MKWAFFVLFRVLILLSDRYNKIFTNFATNKMQDLKTILILLFVTVATNTATAQNVSYTYDAAGNRIKREIVMRRNGAPTRGAKGETEEVYSEMLSKKQVRIYPNPTSGLLKVEVLNVGNEESCTLRLFNSVGTQLISTTTASTASTLDISNQPNGIYVLHIAIGKEESTWKIIKK